MLRDQVNIKILISEKKILISVIGWKLPETISTTIYAFNVDYIGSAILKYWGVGTLVAIYKSPCTFRNKLMSRNLEK